MLGEQIKDWKLVEKLGKGGMGVVWAAEQRLLKTKVAIKLLAADVSSDERQVERFFNEAIAVGKIKHAGIAKIFDCGFHKGRAYLVMELLEGENLARLVDRDRVAIAAVMSIGVQVAAALAALHRAGYIHCDVKPDNVFVLFDELADGWPKLKVIDYGVSRSISGASLDDGTISGTPAYMPPEQWHGKATPKSDVYALGCLLHELVTGEQPFHGSLPRLMMAHTEQRPARPSALRSDVPPALDALVARMLAKDPAMRPAMAEVESLLRRALRAGDRGPDIEPDAVAS